MEIPIVPVIIKQYKEDGSVETVSVKNLFAVPVLLCMHDGDIGCDTLVYEPRVATMINQHMHLLTLSPDREPGQVVYETFIAPVTHTIDAPGEDREPSQEEVEDFLGRDAPEQRQPETHVGRGGVTLTLGAGVHDKHDVQGDAGSPQDPAAISRSADDGGEQVSGGDAAPDSEAVSSGSGEPEQQS